MVLLQVLGAVIPDHVLRPQNRMLGDIRRVPACRDCLTQCLGHGPDMVRGAATTHADIAHAQVFSGQGKLRHLRTGQYKRVQFCRESCFPALLFQVDKTQVIRISPVGNRKRRNGTLDAFHYLCQYRQQGGRPPSAIQSHHVGAFITQYPAGIFKCIAVRRCGCHGRKGDYSRQLEALDHVECDIRLRKPVKGFSHDVINTLIHRPGKLFLIHGANLLAGLQRISGVIDPGIADIRGDQLA